MKNTSLGKLFLLASTSLMAASCSFSLTTSSHLYDSGSQEESSNSGSADSASESTSDSSWSTSSSAESQPGTVVLINSEEYLAFWSHSSDVVISITMTNEALYDLSNEQGHSNATSSDVYFPADLKVTLNGTAYELPEVGIRMKGNTSRRSFVKEDGTIEQAVHFKVSFKATFDGSEYDLNDTVKKYKKTWASAEERKTRKNRTLFDMEKVDFKYTPRNFNGSVVSNNQEIFAYDAFRSEGIMAPRANAVDFHLSDPASQFHATYEAVECIDKTFLKRHYAKDEAQGDLYKCVYGPKGPACLSRDDAVEKNYDAAGLTAGSRVAAGKIGVEDYPANYHPSYDLKTNDDGESSDFSSMVDYINGLWNVVYKGTGKSQLESLLDVDEFLKFSAISQLFGNPDDQRYNANNYYIYFLPSTGQATYIPYDWDWCLGADYSDNQQMKTKTAFDESNFYGSANNVYSATIFSSPSGANLTYDKTDYKNAYYSYIASGIEHGLLSYSRYSSLVSGMKYAEDGELSSVEAFMSARGDYVTQR